MGREAPEKTTTGRLLAKAVNCQRPDDGDPCDACPTCVAVTAGNLLDVIEFDAASHRRIDDMRSILDRVNFSPGEGERKVYIVDEVHMLTTEAANAFLKTLEEPPAHALFVLCTTEPFKLPPTIVSRCQRFDFRRIPLADIIARLDHVCREEGVAADQAALQALARNAAGSLRDAENMLEQVVVSYGSTVALDGVLELLGIGDTGQAMELVQCLLAGNSASALGALNRAAWEGADLRQLHRQTLELLRAVMVHQWGAGESLDLPADVMAEVASLAAKADSDRVHKASRLFANVDLRRDAPSPLPLELAMVETCMDTPVPASAPAPPPMRPTTPATCPRSPSRHPKASQPGLPASRPLRAITLRQAPTPRSRYGRCPANRRVGGLGQGLEPRQGPPLHHRRSAPRLQRAVSRRRDTHPQVQEPLSLGALARGTGRPPSHAHCKGSLERRTWARHTNSTSS